jgi:homoserine acetyltransferase
MPPSAFDNMADMLGYDWPIGPGKALDPARQFLITSELFGNGRSSSPSNTPEPFHGPRFPVTTIRDNVEAVHELLTRGLGGSAPGSVIGFLRGGAARNPFHRSGGMQPALARVRQTVYSSTNISQPF